MKRTTRLIGIGLATTMAALGLEVMEAPGVSAASATLTCQGITGDNASDLGDSKATLGVVAAKGLSLDINVNTTAPAKARPGSGPFDASFDFDVSLPADIIKAAKDTLGLPSLPVRNISMSVNATGAAKDTLTKAAADRTVDLTSSSVRIAETISGKVTPLAAGKIIYRPGQLRMTIVIDKSVAGLKINALTVECSSNNAIGSTSVSVPGAPNIGGNFEGAIWGGAWTGSVGGVKLLGTDLVTPDDGNPVLDDSLAVTAQPANGGVAAAGGGAVFFLAPAGRPGAYAVPMQVCGASRMTKFVVGVNEVQKFTWGTNYRGNDLNTHPLGMTLKVDGKESPVIPLSKTFGSPTPIDMAQWTLFDWFSEFSAPSAGEIQAAIDQIPGIPAGSIKVSGGLNGAPYEFAFTGALGKSDRNLVEIGKWITWFPSDIIDKLPTPSPTTTAPGPTTTTTPLNDDQLWQAIFDGRLTFDEAVKYKLERLISDPALIKNVTKLIPQVPAVAAVTEGVTEEPSVPTGPLCTSFEANFIAVPQPVVVAGTSTTRVRKCSNVRVKTSKGRYTTKRVCRYVTVKKTTKR